MVFQVLRQPPVSVVADATTRHAQTRSLESTLADNSAFVANLVGKKGVSEFRNVLHAQLRPTVK